MTRGPSATESMLLQQVKPAFLHQARYQALIAFRRAERLAATEHVELLQLTEQAEAHQVRWLEALTQLAHLRGRTLPQIMADLRIKRPEYE